MTGDVSGGSVEDLIFARSKKLVASAIKNPYVELIGCARNAETDDIFIKVEVELPQHPPVPINQFENILIEVKSEDDLPNVFALRGDFPVTIHQNAVEFGSPAWLCLYEDPWIDISDITTPEQFIERIREWLKRAAINELHLDDQPLEPFLVTTNKIIIDEGILHYGVPGGHILVGRMAGLVPKMISIPNSDLEKYRKATNQENKKVDFLGLILRGLPSHTQIIPRLPTNLAQLAEILQKIGVGIEDELKKFVSNLQNHFGTIAVFRQKQIIIFLLLPKCRGEGEEPEKTEYWAFVIDLPIGDLGRAIGTLDYVSEHGFGYVLQGKEQKQGDNHGSKDEYENIPIIPFSPILAFNRSLARKSSGISREEIYNCRFGVIGLGALGSQVVINLARQGVGEWVFVDNDLLLPHNLTRHSLSGRYVGLPKTKSLRDSLSIDFNDGSFIEEYGENYIAVSDQGNEEQKKCFSSLASTDIILDFSASRAVSQKLAIDEFDAPRLSVYLVPSGKYCVALYEGESRVVRLDDLEQQLSVFISQSPELHDLLDFKGEQIQYAGSCRDLSMVISNDFFLGYGGVISRFIKQILIKKEPQIAVFSWKENPQSISEIPVPVTKYQVTPSNGWEIRSSGHALSQLKELRDKKLPNETGGVLLGKIVYGRKIIYVSYVLPSPPDSKEWPMAYIRGVRGLQKHVEEFRDVTKGEIVYIGEWHSHPKGGGSNPSDKDKTALTWVYNYMADAGYPGLLAIVGDDDMPNYLIKD